MLHLTVSYPFGSWYCSQKLYVAYVHGMVCVCPSWTDGLGKLYSPFLCSGWESKIMCGWSSAQTELFILKQLGDAVREVGKIQLGLFLIPYVKREIQSSIWLELLFPFQMCLLILHEVLPFSVPSHPFPLSSFGCPSKCSVWGQDLVAGDAMCLLSRRTQPHSPPYSCELSLCLVPHLPCRMKSAF